jgi:tetratricopeptide (TPR) repeat protein
MTELLRSALSHQLTLNRAHAFARAGDLDQAAALLDSLDAAGASTVVSLDLRARVYAQQGNYTEADKCWARVLLLEPANEDASAGRAAVARIAGGGRARPLVNAGRAAVLAAAVVGVAAVGGVVWVTSSGPAPVATASAEDARLQAEAQRDDLQRRLEAADATHQAESAQRSRDLDALAAKFAMPGVKVERREADVRLVFESGVFVSDADVARSAKPLLTEVGRRLAEVRAAPTVVGHAVAVVGGRTSGGSTVAFARAQAAAGYLAAGGKLPLTAFTLATADQAQGPFPDAARNRTVTLVLVPAA